jgi:hypothetical protein
MKFGIVIRVPSMALGVHLRSLGPVCNGPSAMGHPRYSLRAQPACRCEAGLHGPRPKWRDCGLPPVAPRGVGPGPLRAVARLRHSAAPAGMTTVPTPAAASRRTRGVTVRPPVGPCPAAWRAGTRLRAGHAAAAWIGHRAWHRLVVALTVLTLSRHRLRMGTVVAQIGPPKHRHRCRPGGSSAALFRRQHRRQRSRLHRMRAGPARPTSAAPAPARAAPSHQSGIDGMRGRCRTLSRVEALQPARWCERMHLAETLCSGDGATSRGP